MAPKRRGKAKAAKVQAVEEQEEEEENAIIRCICGHYEEEEDEERTMICCDKCDAWQHNDCMGLNTDPNWTPNEYFCEQCAPQNHQELLAAIARGEKPWEQHVAAATGKKKKGKRGRKSGTGTKAGDVHAQESRDAETPRKDSPQVVTVGQKRKHEEPTPSTPQVRDMLVIVTHSDMQTGSKEASSNSSSAAHHTRRENICSTISEAQIKLISDTD